MIATLRKNIWIVRQVVIITITILSSIISRIRFGFLGIIVGDQLSVNGWLNLIIHPKSMVNIGSRVRLNSGHFRNVVGGDRRLVIQTGSGAQLTVGNDSAISNSTIVCFNRITIGSGVFIGGGCNIYDTDFHPISATDRLKFEQSTIKTAPIIIGEKCFIGGHTIILKGVNIGKEVVVGAGAVVANDIPDREIWAGNPARKIGELEN